MNFISTHLLSMILFFPLLAGAIMLFLPQGENKLLRWFAFGASLIPFILSLVVWLQFKSSQPGFQFEESYIWYEAIGSSLHLGVDGLSLTMVLLTTLLSPLAILASFSITDRGKDGKRRKMAGAMTRVHLSLCSSSRSPRSPLKRPLSESPFGWAIRKDPCPFGSESATPTTRSSRRRYP